MSRWPSSTHANGPAWQAAAQNETNHAVTGQIARFPLPPGAATTFSSSAGGLTATFSSAAPGTFDVGSTAGLFSFNSVTGDPSKITFSQAITQPLSFLFGIENLFAQSDSLLLTTDTRETQSFAATLNGLEPQGSVLFQPTSAFTSVVLTTARPYAISNVGVGVGAPEPASLFVLRLDLAGFAAIRRRAA